MEPPAGSTMNMSSPRHNFIYLLGSILLLLVASAITDQYWQRLQVGAIQAAFSATIVIGVWSLSGSTRWFRICLLLMVIEVLLTVLSMVLESVLLKFMDLLVLLVFYMIAMLIAVRQILKPGRVDSNRIVGALCVYLLLGIVWAILMFLIEALHPGSFYGLSGRGFEPQILEFVYVSFVTLSTLGYGDIYPLEPVARMITVLGAITGQFYIAVVVAILVGIFISDQQEERLNRSLREPDD